MNKESCPKCGGQMGSPRYNRYADILETTCTVCAYMDSELPIDRLKQTKEFNQLKG